MLCITCEHLKVSISKAYLRCAKHQWVDSDGKENYHRLRLDEINEDGTITLINDRDALLHKDCSYWSDAETDWDRLKRAEELASYPAIFEADSIDYNLESVGASEWNFFCIKWVGKRPHPLSIEIIRVLAACPWTHDLLEYLSAEYWGRLSEDCFL